MLFVATATALAGVVAGVLYSAKREHVRVAIPLSGGLLLGVALFGLLPELAADLSWTISLVCFAAGFLLLSFIDRMVLRICPDCSEEHHHADCPEPLHGFAVPTLIAAGVHALFDGWALAASATATNTGVRFALPLALVLHKLPEGLALGGMLKTSLRKERTALALGIGAELLTLLGGVAALLLASSLGSGMGSAWTQYPLALAGGFFLFLAAHALLAEWRTERRSTALAGTAGFACSALLQVGIRNYFGV
jgi:zinc transporter ZupT